MCGVDVMQSAGHVVLVVHESAQDSQVHHLEELQVAHSQNTPRPSAHLLHWTCHLHAARSHDTSSAQPVASC